jgi:cobalt/nickel transport system permease protein
MRIRLPLFIAAGLLVAGALAFFVSPYASSQPDGLNKVAIDEGFDGTENAHALADTPTAGYELSGVDDDGLSTGLAGLIGVTATFAVCAGLLALVRTLRRTAPDDPVASPRRAAAGT